MMTAHTRSFYLLPVLIALTLLAGCATGGAFGRGESAARVGDWDAAVTFYRQAVQDHPDRTEYRIALERAMLNASRVHLDAARVLEARGDLEAALREYRRASEFDPPNRVLAAKASEIERRIRDQAEAAQPRSNISAMRAQARQQQPALIAANEIVPAIRFNQSSLRDALSFIGQATGINVTYERGYQDASVTVNLENVTLEQALNQLLSSNQMFYKVQDERTILVIPDTIPNRQRYEEQVIRTFFLSHGDASEVAQIVNTVIRVANMPIPPNVAVNKTANAIIIRASAGVAAIAERLIEANDNPRAEVVIDVQILEVNKTRTRQFGLDLGTYNVSTVFSPEINPSDDGQLRPPPFNANLITRGVSTADFYLAVPSAVIRFLETDNETKLIAKPQLRGAEGQKILLDLGDEVPVPSTVFTPIAQGGANTNPLTSFNYKTVGIKIEMTPRVTPEGDVILDLLLENSTRAQDVDVAGVNLPSFGTRRVTTRLRLRDGESNLLAGLLREIDRKNLRGIPGLIRLPWLNKLLASNDTAVEQTDIVMLLTPRIVRTQELTQQDVSPIFIGTQFNVGLGGPPPLIAPADPASAPAAGAPAPGTPAVPSGNPQPQGGGAVPIVPPGSSPIPGTTAVPAGPTPGAPVPGTPGSTPQATPLAGGAASPAAPASPATSAVAATGGAQIVVTPPGTDFRVGGGPYTVAISAANASRLSAVALTLTYDPTVLRVRTVQEGSLMRAGGIPATFTQQVNAVNGRIDIAIVRSGDTTGVAGTGLLATVLFDAVAPGTASFNVAGSASAPGGAPVPLQVTPVTAVTVR